MKTLIEVKEFLKKENIDIVDYSEKDEDPFITINFKNNTNYVRNIFKIRGNLYSIEINKNGEELLLTISGKKDVIEDFCEIDFTSEVDDKEFDEIIDYLFLFDKIDFSTYFDGVNYYYYISNNEYDVVLNYFGFDNTTSYLRYRTNDNNIFYEIIKDVIKNTKIYRNYVNDVYDGFGELKVIKNAYIDEMKKSFYPQKEKNIVILFKDNKAHVFIENKDFVYDKNAFLMFMLPEVLKMYSETFDEKNKEEINNCVGKCFYTLSDNNKSSIKILNIDEDKIDANIRFLMDRIENKKIRENREMNVRFRTNNKVSYGYVNIFVIGIIILSVGFISFFLTMGLFRLMMR